MGRRKVEKHLDCVAYLSATGTLREIDKKERNQEKVIREYAHRHNIKIVKVISRCGGPLGTVNRQMEQIANLIRKHQVDGVIMTRAKLLSEDEGFVYGTIGKIKGAKGAFVTVDEGRLGMELKECPYEKQEEDI